MPRDEVPADAGEDTDISVLGMLDGLGVDLPEATVALGVDNGPPERDDNRPPAH
jgi:hypothetical protein